MISPMQACASCAWLNKTHPCSLGHMSRISGQYNGVSRVSDRGRPASWPCWGSCTMGSERSDSECNREQRTATATQMACSGRGVAVGREYRVSIGWRVARGRLVMSGIGRVGKGARLASAPEPDCDDSYLFDHLLFSILVVDYFGM